MSLSVRSKVPSQICVLCGTAPASSGQGDHIPPKSFYTKSERQAARFQFHTVPACVECNGAGSRHDEALKLLILLESGEHRPRPNEVIDTVARTIAGNNRLAGQVFSTARQVHLQLESGIRIPVVSVSFDVNSYQKAVTRIARAMYWRITHNVLPASTDIETGPLRQFNQDLIAQLQECQRAFPLTEVNGGSLKCKLLSSGKDVDMLLMQFFGKHTSIALIHHDITSASSRPAPPRASPAA